MAICTTKAQQAAMPYRSSLSGILPNKYYDPDARRMSITVPQQPSDLIHNLPDIDDIPYAFPLSPTPLPQSPLHALLVAHALKQKSRREIAITPEQKKSPACCTIM